MCGIVGYVGPRAATPVLIDGLRKLEYRGYDSAGLAVHDGKAIEVVRTVGKRSRSARCRARPALATRGGLRMAGRASTTRIRTRQVTSPSFTTASSRTTSRC